MDLQSRATLGLQCAGYTKAKSSEPPGTPVWALGCCCGCLLVRVPPSAPQGLFGCLRCCCHIFDHRPYLNTQPKDGASRLQPSQPGHGRVPQPVPQPRGFCMAAEIFAKPRAISACRSQRMGGEPLPGHLPFPPRCLVSAFQGNIHNFACLVLFYTDLFLAPFAITLTPAYCDLKVDKSSVSIAFAFRRKLKPLLDF